MVQSYKESCRCIKIEQDKWNFLFKVKNAYVGIYGFKFQCPSSVTTNEKVPKIDVSGTFSFSQNQLATKPVIVIKA